MGPYFSRCRLTWSGVRPVVSLTPKKDKHSSVDLECAASIVLPSWGPGGDVFLLRGLSLEGERLPCVHLPVDLGSFLFLACPPPDSSSFHEVLTPVPLAAAGHPPSPQLVLMREWGGQAPPSPRSGIGWLRPQQEGSEEREISADREEQWACSLGCHSEGWPQPQGGGAGNKVIFLLSATDPAPRCLNFPGYIKRPTLCLRSHGPSGLSYLDHPEPLPTVSPLPCLVCAEDRGSAPRGSKERGEHLWGTEEVALER